MRQNKPYKPGVGGSQGAGSSLWKEGLNPERDGVNCWWAYTGLMMRGMGGTGRASIANQKQRERKGFISLYLSQITPSLREAGPGAPARNLEAGTVAEAMEGCYLLTFSP